MHLGNFCVFILAERIAPQGIRIWLLMSVSVLLFPSIFGVEPTHTGKVTGCCSPLVCRSACYSEHSSGRCASSSTLCAQLITSATQAKRPVRTAESPATQLNVNKRLAGAVDDLPRKGVLGEHLLHCTIKLPCVVHDKTDRLQQPCMEATPASRLAVASCIAAGANFLFLYFFALCSLTDHSLNNGVS